MLPVTRIGTCQLSNNCITVKGMMIFFAALRHGEIRIIDLRELAHSPILEALINHGKRE